MSDYEKLNKLCNQIDELISSNDSYYSESFTIWMDKCERFLIKKYGAESSEYASFYNIKFRTSLLDKKQEIYACQRGLKIAKGLFESLLEEMNDDNTESTNVSTDSKSISNQVFIVHGHDEAFKLKIKDLLTKIGIEGIILHEQANVGRTIIEKIEYFGKNVGAAIILYTPDDMGKANEEPDYKSRARQNVIFESGFFMGYLGRNKVAHVVSDSSMEIPGDLRGVVYVDKSNWQFDLIKELKAMGFEIDANRLL